MIIVVRNYMRGPKCPSLARMDSKIVIITGANSGIGFETAKNLVSRGELMSAVNTLFAVFFVKLFSVL